MTYQATEIKRAEIGRGRSGIVYLQDDGPESKLACKVFDSRGLTKIVQRLTLGAPNPYVWSNDAAQCAMLRRSILAVLVPYWMDGKMSVANAVAALRNEEHRTFELQTRMVHGWAAHLHHPLSDEFKDEAEHLWKDLMPALRAHLSSAGFDGLLWQAGEGNPVALNNFLFEPGQPVEGPLEGKRPNGQWVWIDLESGVPAIFPISLRVLFSYSFRHWRRLGRPMFDDVDIPRLMAYLETNAGDLTQAIGEHAYQELISNVRRLEHHQAKWKAFGHHASSVQYRLARGDIDEAQADYFKTHRLRWLLREAKLGLLSSVTGFKAAIGSVLRLCSRIDLRESLSSVSKFLTSQSYREDFIQDFLRSSIEKWRKRGQLNDADAEYMLRQVGAPDASVYLTDFGIHLAIKPVVKVIQYWILPALFAFGVLNAMTLAFLVLAGGSIARSAYTLWRLVQSATRGAEKPWLALGVGLLPIVGNLAFPAQMIYSSGDKNEKLAKFLLDDGFARVGRHVPIWGGEDTWTEHWFNRIPNRIGQFFRRISRKTKPIVRENGLKAQG